MRFRRVIQVVGVCAALTVATPLAWAQMGHVLNGVGPVNQSMAGTSTGLPLDAGGAQYWNSASISALPASALDVGLEFFWPTIELSSVVSPPNPGQGAGSNDSQFTLSFIPTVSAVFVDDEHESPWTFGVGAYGVSGFGVDYPSDLNNPILRPQPLGGFGQIYSQYTLAQIYGTASYEIVEGLSLGLAPILDVASLVVEPFPAVPPGPAGYPNSDTSFAVGGGFQAGVYYETPFGLSVGGSFKSNQWFSDFSFSGTGGREWDFRLDFPMIVSGGLGYEIAEGLHIGADVRYIDYAGTEGFSESGFDAFGAVRGFGWKSIWTVSTGIQYALTETISLRAGYAYNQNPITSETAFFNVAAPAIIQHHLGVGASWRFVENWAAHLAYTHGFENSVSGPMYNPGFVGPIPGTSVETTMSTNSLIIGITWEFGERKSTEPEIPVQPAVGPDAVEGY